MTFRLEVNWQRFRGTWLVGSCAYLRAELKSPSRGDWNRLKARNYWRAFALLDERLCKFPQDDLLAIRTFGFHFHPVSLLETARGFPKLYFPFHLRQTAPFLIFHSNSQSSSFESLDVPVRSDVVDSILAQQQVLMDPIHGSLEIAVFFTILYERRCFFGDNEQLFSVDFWQSNSKPTDVIEVGRGMDKVTGIGHRRSEIWREVKASHMGFILLPFLCELYCHKNVWEVIYGEGTLGHKRDLPGDWSCKREEHCIVLSQCTVFVSHPVSYCLSVSVSISATGQSICEMRSKTKDFSSPKDIQGSPLLETDLNALSLLHSLPIVESPDISRLSISPSPVPGSTWASSQVAKDPDQDLFPVGHWRSSSFIDEQWWGNQRTRLGQGQMVRGRDKNGKTRRGTRNNKDKTQWTQIKDSKSKVAAIFVIISGLGEMGAEIKVFKDSDRKEPQRISISGIRRIQTKKIWDYYL